MKQKILSRLVCAAFSSAAAIGLAHAGNIDQTATTIAQEVIKDDTTALLAPAKTYSFVAPVTADLSDQSFQIQFTISGGEFDLPGAIASTFRDTFAVSDTTGKPLLNLTPATADGSHWKKCVDSLLPAGMASSSFDACYVVNAAGVSSDKKTAWATITILQGAKKAIQPVVTFNASSSVLASVAFPNDVPVGATATVTTDTLGNTETGDAPLQSVEGSRIGIVKLRSGSGLGSEVAGDGYGGYNCTPRGEISIVANVFSQPDNPLAIASATNHATPAETSGMPGSGYLALPTSLLFRFTPATGVKLGSDGLGFSGNTLYVNAAGDAVALGFGTLAKNAAGRDVGSGQYGWTSIDDVATASRNDGAVEVDIATGLVATIYSTDGFTEGAVLEIHKLPGMPVSPLGYDCVSGSIYGAITVGAADVNKPFLQIALDGNDTGKLFATVSGAGQQPNFAVCYNVSGIATPITPTSFSMAARLVKADGPANLAERDNACFGPLVNFTGGVKIDVRNYAAPAPGQAWQSVIRLINTHETGTATVNAQIITHEGKFGPYGQIAVIPPRGVVNLSSPQIEPMLTNEGKDGPIRPESYYGAGDAAPRLRISATGVDTLRVQNYMVNPATGQVMEFSSSQGVDFGSELDRSAGEGQQISQDARAGIDGL